MGLFEILRHTFGSPTEHPIDAPTGEDCLPTSGIPIGSTALYFGSKPARNAAAEPALDIVESALGDEPQILARALAGSDTDAIRVIDAHWPNEAPFDYDHSVDMLREPWLDDPDFAPDVTLKVKAGLIAALRETSESTAWKVRLIYLHWPFSGSRTPTVIVP